jgi:hypothetical protein
METPPDIHLHIDRVILDRLPFTATDAAPIRAALEAELIRIVGATFQAMPTASVTLDALPAAQLVLKSTSASGRFGSELAAILGASLLEAFAIPTAALSI